MSLPISPGALVRLTTSALLATALLGFPFRASAQQPLTSAFTYQGELASAGTPASGTYDIRFRLYDAANGGSQIGSTVCSDNVAVDGGRFATSLDFGAAAFNGQKRFLEIEVRADTGLDCSDATGYTVLTPRQELTAAPQAAYALTASNASNAVNLNGQSSSFYQNAANLTGTLPSGLLSGTYTRPLTLNNPANTLTGNGAGITNLSATSISTGVLDVARMPTNWAAGGDLSGFFPAPTINAGAVTLSKLAPSVQGVLSKLSSLVPAPTPLDVVTWGDNYWYNQSFIPALLPGVTYSAVSTGNSHALALRSDGTAVGWGRNDNGQCNVPALPPGLRYTSVSAGFWHSLALRSDGMVVAWGWNLYNQCNVPALPPGVTYTAVASGANHSTALRSDGTIVAWGDNRQGQTNVSALPPGVTYIAVASNGEADHTLGLRSDGSLVAWGRNAEGQLWVPSLPPGVRYTTVAAGSTHNLGVVSDGGVVAWGGSGNNYGQISGLGPPPVGVTYSAVAAGYRHSIALRSDGVLLAWGNPAYGVTSVPALPSGVIYTAVAAGNNQTIALRGIPQSPSLGAVDGLSIGSSTPPPANGGISVAGASSFAAAVSAASFTGSGAGLTNLNASNITSGTLAAAQIPGLDASKITSGTLAAAQIPGLDASKITSGTLAAAQIPNLDASKITTGTLATAQIPNLDVSKITSGTLSTNLLPVSAWVTESLPTGTISGSAFAAVNGTSRTISMRQGVAVVNWSISGYSNVAFTDINVRIRAVTNGTSTLGPTTIFTFNQAGVHSTISGNAVIAIPATANTTFTLEVARTGGTGIFNTDSRDSFTASIINVGQ